MCAKNMILCRQPFDLFQNHGFSLIFDHFYWFLGWFLTKMSWFFWTYDQKSQKNQRKNKNFTFLMQNSESTWKIDPRNTSKHYTTIIFIYLFDTKLSNHDLTKNHGFFIKNKQKSMKITKNQWKSPEIDDFWQFLKI